MASSAFKAEKLVKKSIVILCPEIDELWESVEMSKSNVKTVKDLVSRLQSQVQQESEAKVENNDHTPENQQLLFDLMEAQLKLEFAQADPVVSSERIAIAKDCIKLLMLISNAEKAYKAFEGVLRSKSQARLNSQV